MSKALTNTNIIDILIAYRYLVYFVCLRHEKVEVQRMQIAFSQNFRLSNECEVCNF